MGECIKGGGGMEIAIISMEQYENRERGSVGSSRIRAEWVAKYWDKAELYQLGKKYDVLIFQKAYWQDMVKSFDGLKIFDLCDPDWLDNRPVVEMIRYCHGVVTSTEALAKQIRKFDIGDIPVVCVPDRVDLEWSVPRHPKHEGKAEKVVYYGYYHNTKVLDATVDPLKKRGLKLVVIADQPYHGNDEFIKWDTEIVNQEIIKNDIVLLPDAPSSDYRFQFKSNNKTIQAWALRMPVAKTAKDLDRFMNGEEREREAERRFREVEKSWDVKLSVREWGEFVKVADEYRRGCSK